MPLKPLALLVALVLGLVALLFSNLARMRREDELARRQE